MADYFSFEDVLKELELSEEDLKRMVSEGELRAFRDENKMKFKKEDVDHLKKGRITEPTIILPSTPSGSQDETVLDLDIGKETAEIQAAGSGDELLLQQNQEEQVGVEETFIDEENDSGLTTEPLKLADEVETAETVESEAVTEPLSEEEGVVAVKQPRRRTQQMPAATEEELERRRPSPVWAFVLIFGFVASLYSTLFGIDTIRLTGAGQAGEQPSGMTAGLGKWVLEQFWADSAWTKFHISKFPEGQQPPFEKGSSEKYPIKHTKYDGPSFHKIDVAERPPVK